MRELMAQDHPHLRELAKIEDAEIVELPTGLAGPQRRDERLGELGGSRQLRPV